MLIPRIELAFQDQGEALEVIKTGIRRELLADSSDSSDSSRDWVWRGTDHWDNLQSFVFRDDAIEFLFAPYTVGPYSRGSQSALIKYSEIVQLMRHEFVHALDISHLNCR